MFASAAFPTTGPSSRAGSHCPACGAAIRWHDNIPLLSWVFLRGCCRDCGARISLRYPAVELLTAVFFTASYVWFGPTLLTVKVCIFSFLAVGLLFMDAETRLLPREFTYTGIALGLGFSWIAPTDDSATQFLLHAYNLNFPTAQVSFLDALLGATLGAGFFFIAAGLYFVIRKRQGMGIGDFALIAMSGTFLGAEADAVGDLYRSTHCDPLCTAPHGASCHPGWKGQSFRWGDVAIVGNPLRRFH